MRLLTDCQEEIGRLIRDVAHRAACQEIRTYLPITVCHSTRRGRRRGFWSWWLPTKMLNPKWPVHIASWADASRCYKVTKHSRPRTPSRLEQLSGRKRTSTSSHLNIPSSRVKYSTEPQHAFSILASVLLLLLFLNCFRLHHPKACFPAGHSPPALVPT